MTETPAPVEDVPGRAGTDLVMDFTTSSEDLEDLSELLTSDMDLGEFDPPVEHVAMSDVLKKDRSPPDYQTTTTVESSDCFGENVGLDDDFSGAPYDEVADRIAPERQLHDAFNELQDFDSEAATPAESSSIETAGDTELIVTPHGDLPAIAEKYAHETEDEQKKKLYEEDQKKKWEGIDQWIYDEFHEYVELI